MATTITRPVIKRCPHRDETDAGQLTITFPGHAPELHDLAAKVDALCELPITHEAFTDHIRALVPGAHVETTWHTGPWSVEVTS
jgi:hypothetical protein